MRATAFSLCSYARDFRARLWLNIEGREKAPLWAYRVRLDNVERSVLFLLGMTPIFIPIKVSPVGFKDVLDAVPKGLDKFSAISAKFHIFDDSLAAHCCKFFK